MPSGGPRPRTARHRGPPPGGGTLSRPPRAAAPEIRDEKGAPYMVGKSSAAPFFITKAMTFNLLLTVRLSAAFWTSVSDCDETFNYWEPLHFFLYGKGFQTWEYSPEFALRSYLYVLVHTIPAWLYQVVVQPNPMYVFFFLRCILATVCASAEVYFIYGISREIGTNIARLTMVFLLLSCGLFISSTALLPSTTSMYLTMLSYGAWFRHNFKLAIFFTAISTFISWPFAALIGVPIALDILVLRGKWKFFIRWCVISAAVTVVPQIMIDSQYYGKTVLAPLNIVLYNVFTSHGPDLYGTEEWTFYFMNGFLNFNVVFFLALLALPFLLVAIGLAPEAVRTQTGDIPRYLILLGLYLWLLVFMGQPHKEERFLFPVYPLLAMAAAISIDLLQKLWFKFTVRVQNRHYLEHTNWISFLVMAVFAILSGSRILAVYNHYSAPMSTWMHVAHLPFLETEQMDLPGPVHVCVGKEWHRFPSSFFLPNKDWEMKYLKSEFRGQLPQPYLSGENATQAVRSSFNDKNLEESNRYEISEEECHFLVDWDNGLETPLEKRYSQDQDRWTVEHSLPFLVASQSHRFFRAFYVPVVGQEYCKFGEYVLLRNTNPPQAPKKRSKSKKIRHL